jgi:hypothetical protein
MEKKPPPLPNETLALLKIRGIIIVMMSQIWRSSMVAVAIETTRSSCTHLLLRLVTTTTSDRLVLRGDDHPISPS